MRPVDFQHRRCLARSARPGLKREAAGERSRRLAATGLAAAREAPLNRWW